LKGSTNEKTVVQIPGGANAPPPGSATAWE